ncbi:MAG: histidine kinase [Polyangiales bacterium]
MRPATDSQLPRTDAPEHEGPLLPPELPWVLLIMPLPAAYLLGHELLDQSPLPFLVSVLKTFLPFMAFGGTFQLLYRYVMPGPLRRARSRLARFALHAIALVTVVLVLGSALVPVVQAITKHPISWTRFVILSTIFSITTVVPSLMFQQLRLRARRAEHRALTERKAALEAQLAALQARTDPHFLFNSLNTVASLIPEDPVLAERTLEHLADLFRYALDSGRLRTVKLERELTMLTHYLELQSTRFGERLETHLEVESGLEHIDLPPLLLQPLVENAILHGTSQRRGGRVDIAVRREHDDLIVEVRDDGPGPGRSQHAGAGTAVSSIAERLALHYAERASLSLTAAPNGGCLARLTLPAAGAA